MKTNFKPQKKPKCKPSTPMNWRINN